MERKFENKRRKNEEKNGYIHIVADQFIGYSNMHISSKQGISEGRKNKRHLYGRHGGFGMGK